MLHFEPCTAETLQTIAGHVRSLSFRCNDLSVGSLLMWRRELKPSFCLWRDTFMICQDMGGAPAFSYPIGPAAEEMLDELIAFVQEKELALRFFALDDDTLQKVLDDKRFSNVLYAKDERWSDYIYDIDAMSTFAGKKLSGQRNHTNKYKKLYGESVIRPLGPADRGALLSMLDRYEREHPDQNSLEKAELRYTRELLDFYSLFNMPAACLELEGQIIGFSIGEIVGDMLIVHVEKALTAYEGVYPTLCRGFVNYVRENFDGALRIVNREDDSGNPGLRISKRQYHPIGMVPKYQAQVSTPAARLDGVPTLRTGRLVLTPLRDTDRQAYRRLNTDAENNRWWGYDYREDINIFSPVDDDTFYTSVLYDMAIGDSVNFAVRESEDGDMIGEAVLWNFTYNGGAEAGCRLFPEYHGARLGSEAIGAITRYGEEVLGLRMRARCCLENTPSYHMLIRAGFVPDGEDETYYYFKR